MNPRGLNARDFRSQRFKLPPEAFAIHPEGPEPEPQDVIQEEVWRSVVALPDDVSIRTSDDYGTEIKAMNDLWSSVIEMSSETKDAWNYTLLDMADGGYRQAYSMPYVAIIGSLRHALEQRWKILLLGYTCN